MDRTNRRKSGSALFSQWFGEDGNPTKVGRDCANCSTTYAPLRAESISGKPTKRKRDDTEHGAPQHAGIVQQNLEAWKRKLAVSLNHDLSHMQNKLDASIRVLSEEFEKNCQDLDGAEQVLTSTLAQETVSVVRDGGEPVQINLGQHVQEFRNVYKEKSQQLREYWKQYGQVQTEIERFVIEVIGHAAFEASATGEESDKPATSTKLEQAYDHAREQYAARKTELQIFTNQALEDNKKIIEGYKSQEQATLRKLRGLMEHGG